MVKTTPMKLPRRFSAFACFLMKIIESHKWFLSVYETIQGVIQKKLNRIRINGRQDKTFGRKWDCQGSRQFRKQDREACQTRATPPFNNTNDKKTVLQQVGAESKNNGKVHYFGSGQMFRLTDFFICNSIFQTVTQIKILLFTQ